MLCVCAKTNQSVGARHPAPYVFRERKHGSWLLGEILHDGQVLVPVLLNESQAEGAVGRLCPGPTAFSWACHLHLRAPTRRNHWNGQSCFDTACILKVLYITSVLALEAVLLTSLVVASLVHGCLFGLLQGENCVLVLLHPLQVY